MKKLNTVSTANLNAQDDGRFGKAMESADTLKRCKPSNKVDAYHHRLRYEWKTGAGELGNAGGRLLPKCDLVAYVPVVEEGKTLDAQEGFILTREGFIQALEEAGAIREKISTAGTKKITIQTFWNRKQNKPHGSLYYRLLDALYDNMVCTLQEWVENGKRIEEEA